MEQHEIRLVEEDNTIYEIDMDCIRKKQLAAKRAMEADEMCIRDRSMHEESFIYISWM